MFKQISATLIPRCKICSKICSNVLGIRWKNVMEGCLIHDFSDMVDDATVGCFVKQ